MCEELFVCPWRLLFTARSLHPSCSLLSCCLNFWQCSDPPTSSGPPAFPLLLSVCLSLFFPSLVLCQFQLVWQIRSRGCHGNPSFPHRVMDHPLIAFLPSQLPKKAHPKYAQLHLDIEGWSPFIFDSFTITHSFKLQSQHFPLLCLPPFTPRARFTWVSQVRKLTLWVSAESHEMSLYVQFKWRCSRPCLCGICHTSSSAGRNHSLQRRILTCRHLRHREMNRFPRSYLNLTDTCCMDGTSVQAGATIRNSVKHWKHCRILLVCKRTAHRIQLHVLKPAHHWTHWECTKSARAAASVALIYQHKLR